MEQEPSEFYTVWSSNQSDTHVHPADPSTDLNTGSSSTHPVYNFNPNALTQPNAEPGGQKCNDTLSSAAWENTLSLHFDLTTQHSDYTLMTHVLKADDLSILHDLSLPSLMHWHIQTFRSGPGAGDIVQTLTLSRSLGRADGGLVQRSHSSIIHTETVPWQQWS